MKKNMKPKKAKLTKINVRLDLIRLDEIARRLCVDRSKAIRACMNCTDNVLQNIFGGEVSNVFRRKRKNEELDYYEDP